MAKRFSLTVHRNKVEAQRKRAVAKYAREQVEKIIREEDIRAYAFVGISASGQGYAVWDTGAILPLWAFAPTVEAVLRRDIENSGVDEDWTPALTVKGGK